MWFADSSVVVFLVRTKICRFGLAVLKIKSLTRLLKVEMNELI